ncbi:MAG: permease [Alphaproteobacteria bacterium]|uniref:Permease n=1 Tax=Candidatus Nitrobium versatile TaxID=2884831 RepID=A0A953M116_9BACT|nr:permease [Candidatus Nitrobium versatile]
MLKDFAEHLTYRILDLPSGSRLAGAAEFFIYDSIKIFLLLSVVIFTVSLLRSHFPPKKTKRILSHKKEFMGNIFAALLGVVTPFCSCSAVPLFIGTGFLTISTPGLVVNGRLKHAGTPLPGLEKVKELIGSER